MCLYVQLEAKRLLDGRADFCTKTSVETKEQQFYLKSPMALESSSLTPVGAYFTAPLAYPVVLPWNMLLP